MTDVQNKTATSNRPKKRTWEKVTVSEESEEGGIDSVCLEMYLMPEVQYEKPDWSNILHGKFAFVGFIGGQRKKTHYKYVCCVQYVEEEQEISVTGYKCHNELATVFVVKENDECVITLNQIPALLPDPEMKETDRKINHIFPRICNHGMTHGRKKKSLAGCTMPVHFSGINFLMNSTPSGTVDLYSSPSRLVVKESTKRSTLVFPCV
ncbi:hypothetical protein C0J52_22412 [Blattella germanica]|nr:hypothetical protein C0J52_22412 [Blattella germanica]